jgi:hypothetical protein
MSRSVYGGPFPSRWRIFGVACKISGVGRTNEAFEWRGRGRDVAVTAAHTHPAASRSAYKSKTVLAAAGRQPHASEKKMDVAALVCRIWAVLLSVFLHFTFCWFYCCVMGSWLIALLFLRSGMSDWSRVGGRKVLLTLLKLLTFYIYLVYVKYFLNIQNYISWFNLV